MTAQQLREKFNNEFGLSEWPKTYEVDHDTYANVCQYIFNLYSKPSNIENLLEFKVYLGPNKGIMFKNVELILKYFLE